MIIERMIQQIIPGKCAELETIDQKYNAVEARLGYPLKRHYLCLTGGHTTDTLIIEREWDSLAAMEVAYTRPLLIQNIKPSMQKAFRSLPAYESSCTCRCKQLNAKNILRLISSEPRRSKTQPPPC